MSKPEQLGYHVDELEHVEETDSLLYTRKELQDYMELLHSKRSSKAVTFALTAQYCANPSSCGEYQPTGTLGFELDNLAQSTLKVLDWKSYLWDALDTWGHYASCLIILYLMGKLIYILVSVVATCRKGTSWVTAIRLNTFLLTEFRNNLVQTLNEPERRAAAASPHGIELEELN